MALTQALMRPRVRKEDVMKLLTYDTGTGPRCGVLQDDHVVDVTALLGAPQTLRDVQSLLAWDEASVDQVRDALARDVAALALPLARVRLRPPRSPATHCAGLYNL